MGTIRQVKEKFENAYNSIPDAVAETVQRTSDVLLDLNKDQLLAGRDADGNVLNTGYLQDPYFLTQKMAMSYLRKKIRLDGAHRERISFPGAHLFPEKHVNTPNLIITGAFQDSMFIKTTKDSYSIGATYEDADAISAKYNHRIYGEAPQSKTFYYFNYIRDAILSLFRK
jgi:hypothetical protein